MIGILVILGASWLLLHLIERKDLSVLGFAPVSKRVFQLFLGLGFILILQALLSFTENLVLSTEWAAQSSFSWRKIGASLWYHTRSAATEDLIFRGALLYILGTRFTNWIAIMVSGAAFGIYHWFSYGMFGSGIIPMTYIFLVTGTAGAVWAYTYFRTNSVFMALGFHVAWNFALSLYMDVQPFGEILFYQVSSTPLSEWNNFFFQFTKGLAPSLLTYLFVKFYTQKKAVTVTATA